MEMKTPYRIETLNAEEYATFLWLIDRGYAGDFGALEGERLENGGWRFEPLPEHIAWQVRESVEQDRHAFLTCNGSASLAEKLNSFLEAIV